MLGTSINKSFALRLRTPALVLISISMCFGQSPKRRSAGQANAPFLQDAASYEETPYVTKLVLKNGLTVLVDEYRTMPVVSVQSYVSAGFRDEPAKSPGLAGLLAAMVCRGTKDQTIGTYRQQIQSLGGSFRCSADYEKTSYELTSTSSRWKRALQIQADALLNPSLDPESLELEAKLIRGEARGELDDPDMSAREKLLEIAFDQSRMGEINAIAAGAASDLTRESLVEFHSKAYTPGKMTIVISGDVRASDILNEVVRIYGQPAQRSTQKLEQPAGNKQEEFRYRAIGGNVAFPRVLLGFHTVSEKAEDYGALEILSAILGSGDGSVLVTRLRDQKGLILKGQTQLTSYAESGFLEISMEVDPSRIDLSEIGALTEIELLKRDEPSAADMARAAAQLELLYWKQQETAPGRAEMLAHFESLGDWKLRDRYLSELRKVKPSDVRRVANRYLRLQNCSLLEYLPLSERERNLTAETAAKKQSVHSPFLPRPAPSSSVRFSVHFSSHLFCAAPKCSFVRIIQPR
jgi:zinc protease